MQVLVKRLSTCADETSEGGRGETRHFECALMTAENLFGGGRPQTAQIQFIAGMTNKAGTMCTGQRGMQDTYWQLDWNVHGFAHVKPCHRQTVGSPTPIMFVAARNHSLVLSQALPKPFPVTDLASVDGQNAKANGMANNT